MAYIFDPSRGETPQSIAEKRAFANEILRRMGRYSAPRNTWDGIGQGLAALGDGIVARAMRQRADAAEREGMASAEPLKQQIFNAITTGSVIPMSGGASEIAVTAPSGSGGMNYRDAIASIESRGSGDYAAIGPRHPKMGRAMGRYQIMESNIGPWSREALGREVTPDEFMANPQLQDAIFDHRFGQYVKQYGPEGAAQAWFGGPGGVGKTNRKDVLGTSIGGYGQRFMNAIGGSSGEVAASSPEAAFGAVMPELSGGPSLSDEVAEYQQTPEYRERFPGMAEQPFDAGRFGDEIPIQPVQGRGGLATALAANNPAMSGQAAIGEQTSGIPAQFRDSRQILNAQGGIMPALMGGTPATEQQIAEAYARESQPMQGGNPSRAGNGLSMDFLFQAASNPFLMQNEGMRSIVNTLIQEEMKKRDPSYQLDMDYRRAQVDKMRREADAEKRQPLINAGGGAIYDPNTGEWLRPPAENGGNGAFRFGGNSVEAQALNGLMDSGQLTPEQAQQLGAGKTITGPNGEIIFLTPQGVFGAAPDGRTQRLSSEGVRTSGSNPSGNITITEPKVTLDERKAMGFADRMSTSGALIDGNEKAGLKPWDQFVRGNDWIPDFAENWLVGEDFQKFDQARRDFVNAQLRRESGAVISDEEFDNANKQYFPQPGDTEDVLRQKAQNRKVVIDGMKRDAGPTYRGIGGDPLADARKAIAAGADRNAVIQRLRENGIDPGGL